MKKSFRSIIASVCLCCTLLNGISVCAAGYDVLMEPQIDYVDENSKIETYFFPTPFNRGFSVVHNDTVLIAGFEASYYDISSNVVDSYGNIVDVGEYDCLGVWPFDFDESLSKGLEGYDHPFQEYTNPQFDKMEGVDSLGYIVVAKNGKGGLIDTKGNIIIPCEFDELYDAYKLYGVEYPKNEYGVEYPRTELANDWYAGKYFNADYDLYSYLEHYGFSGYAVTCYYNGLAVVKESDDDNAKVGIVDKEDRIIVPFVYDMITPCYDKECWVLKDGKWGIISVNKEAINVTINGNAVEFDQQPLLINGRTLAPIRAISENLNATVEWNGDTQEIKITHEDVVINMTIGMCEMYKNGEMIWLDEAPCVVGDRTLVPIRAIAEAFDCKVDWNGESNTVVIND